MTIWCRQCWKGLAIVAGAFPAVCPSCQLPRTSEDWTALYLGAWPFALSHMDKKFLRSIRVAADDPVSDDDGA